MGELKVKIQKFGAFLSGMVMPNIGCIYCVGYFDSIIYSGRMVSK